MDHCCSLARFPSDSDAELGHSREAEGREAAAGGATAADGVTSPAIGESKQEQQEVSGAQGRGKAEAGATPMDVTTEGTAPAEEQREAEASRAEGGGVARESGRRENQSQQQAAADGPEPMATSAEGHPPQRGGAGEQGDRRDAREGSLKAEQAEGGRAGRDGGEGDRLGGEHKAGRGVIGQESLLQRLSELEALITNVAHEAKKFKRIFDMSIVSG